MDITNVTMDCVTLDKLANPANPENHEDDCEQLLELIPKSNVLVQEIFEDVYKKPHCPLTRDSVEWNEIREDLSTLQLGQHCEIPTNGNSTGYYYRTLDDHHIIIFCERKNGEESFTGHEISSGFINHTASIAKK
jgi:hypothetical protein